MKLRWILGRVQAPVAPRAGAWIETFIWGFYDNRLRSPLARGRGLKRHWVLR